MAVTPKVESPARSGPAADLTVAGLFAGIGGLELGLHAAGATTSMLCESWSPAQAVLQARFPDVEIHPDVRTLPRLPDVDIVTAGFPCTDLSQAGRTAGIHGEQSGLVSHLFRLLARSKPRWVVIENVRNMLVLDGGRAMSYLVHEFESLGYDWAYRLVDSRFTGTPQRRQRVLFVASIEEDPRRVLFADDVGEPDESAFREDAYGFFWTEGLRGLGWAKDALPTLKGGSAIGIPSPPAIWVKDAQAGRGIVTPDIEDAEKLQGFPAGWTSPAGGGRRGAGVRWKLIGNAVTVGVSSWLGRRLAEPGNVDQSGGEPIESGAVRWPTAAWGVDNEWRRVPLSMWPEFNEYRHLLDVVDRRRAVPLSLRATEGFFGRLQRSTLRVDEDFRLALKQHIQAMQPAA